MPDSLQISSAANLNHGPSSLRQADQQLGHDSAAAMLILRAAYLIGFVVA
jgi:hypothetical protein